MHIQPKILCAAYISGQLLEHGAYWVQSLWGKISYRYNGGKDRYLIFCCSLQEQLKLELSRPVKELDSSCSLMNTILRNLKDFSFIPLFFSMHNSLWFSFIWNPWFLLKSHYFLRRWSFPNQKICLPIFSKKSLIMEIFTSGNTPQNYFTFSSDQLF